MSRIISAAGRGLKLEFARDRNTQMRNLYYQLKQLWAHTMGNHSPLDRVTSYRDQSLNHGDLDYLRHRQL